MKEAVLVLDAVPQTLAVVRSLARAGFHVVLGRPSHQRRSHVEWSRHCHEVWPHPPFTDAVSFGDALTRLIDARPEIRIIFPVAETSMDALRARLLPP